MRIICSLLAASLVAQAQFIIDTYAGRYNPPLGSTATSFSLGKSLTGVSYLAADGRGYKYYLPYNSSRNQIVQIGPGNTVEQVFGSVSAGFVEDGTPVGSALFNNIQAIAADVEGNVFIAEGGSHRIRRISSDGTISTICGTGKPGFSGDGGLAVAAQISGSVLDLAVGLNGVIYFADTGNGRVRKVEGGIVTTVAGNGSLMQIGGSLYPAASGDGGPAIKAGLNPASIGVDIQGNLVVADLQYTTPYILSIRTAVVTVLRFVDHGTGLINKIPLPAGTAPMRARMDPAGRILFTSWVTSSVMGLKSTDRFGNVTAVVRAGQVPAAYSEYLDDFTSDPDGNLYLFDRGNPRILRIDANTSVVSAVAGNQFYSFSGDRGAAVNCQLSGVPFIATAPNGDVYVVDRPNGRIRRISAATGIIDEVPLRGVGSYPTAGYATLGIGGGPIAVDRSGNVYMSDYSRYVYKIDGKTGLITVIAGTGEAGGSGDGGPATAAQLDTPGALAMDSLGGLYVAVTGNTGIRKIDLASGAISTVISTADLPAEFQARQRAGALAIDADGNLFLSVSDLLFGYYRTGSILKISTKAVLENNISI